MELSFQRQNFHINNHKATFRFIVATKTKIYAVSINPKIEAHELTLDIPGLDTKIPKTLVDCNEFLVYDMDDGYVAWNPWLNQSRWVEPEIKQPNMIVVGIGYDNKRRFEESTKSILEVYDFASGKWIGYDFRIAGCDINITKEAERYTTLHHSISFNGELYFLASRGSLFFLVIFSFSTVGFSRFCDLPCVKKDPLDALFLSGFKGDRFSLLKQCRVTKKIEIWVTKEKIYNGCGKNVEWIKFMEVSSPSLLDLIHTGYDSRLSYYIENKRLVMCSCDQTARVWIYVVEGNKLISKTQISCVGNSSWPLHCTYFPRLVSVPQGQKDEA
ncbi:unnamed protein product [Cochlearia groenlandica]